MFFTELRTRASFSVICVVLVACAQPAPIAPSSEATPASPVAVQPSSPPEPTAIAAPQPEQVPDPAAAAHLATQALEMLNLGEDEQANTALRQALAMDPKNKLAISLMRQMSEDPNTKYGRESFAYVVKKGDSLSQIAGHFLGDVQLFPSLAKYNGIKVPKLMAEGQTIRIPGKMPVEPPAVAQDSSKGRIDRAYLDKKAPVTPPLTPAEQAFQKAQNAEKAGSLIKAFDAYKQAASLGHSGAPGKVDDLKAKVTDLHAKAARSALARQNLDLSIAEWDQVLQLKPGDETAQLERQKVMRLKTALQKK